MRRTLVLLLATCLATGSAVLGQSQSRNSSSAKSTKAEPYSKSAAAKAVFMRESGYSHGRPGYVVSYRKTLACGGADDPSNMEWQTIAEAKAKSKAGKQGCK